MGTSFRVFGLLLCIGLPSGSVHVFGNISYTFKISEAACSLLCVFNEQLSPKSLHYYLQESSVYLLFLSADNLLSVAIAYVMK